MPINTAEVQKGQLINIQFLSITDKTGDLSCILKVLSYKIEVSGYDMSYKTSEDVNKHSHTRHKPIANIVIVLQPKNQQTCYFSTDQGQTSKQQRLFKQLYINSVVIFYNNNVNDKLHLR